MKIGCDCGSTIADQTDYLPYKAHFIPDQEWFGVLEAVDEAIENSGPSAMDKEAACMKVRQLIREVSRLAWQCFHCGRVYIDDQNYELRQLVPGTSDVPMELFRSRPSKE